MTVFLCKACGTSYPDAARPPIRCPICEDERQYIPPTGQDWLAREELGRGHRNAWHLHEPGLYSLLTVPAFAINQRAFLLQTPAGNVLWDCIGLLDEATKALVHGLGGIAAIAISHPHYYTTMQDWAAAFDAPIHLHAADRRWIMRPDSRIRLWEGDALELWPGVTLVRGGGHFPGGTVLHWADGAEGKGVLMAGDTCRSRPARIGFPSCGAIPT